MPFKKVGGKMSLEFEPSSSENKHAIGRPTLCSSSTDRVIILSSYIILSDLFYF